jgi:large subunit ribosomal protein L18
MDAHKSNTIRTERRKHRVRKAIHGTAQKPRLSVHRTNLQIYAQLIDDDAERTIAAAASNAKDGKLKYGGNVAAAAEVGKKIAEKAKAKGITEAAFDRGAYRFHGRVKALARAATQAGLKCTSLEDKKKTEAAPAEAKDKKKPAKA